MNESTKARDEGQGYATLTVRNAAAVELREFGQHEGQSLVLVCARGFELLLRSIAALIRRRKRRTIGTRRGEEIRRFYRSVEWKRLRFEVLIQNPRCTLCGASAQDGARLNVDHIKPLSKRWDLRLTMSNLQTLCASCNWGKGGWNGK